VKQITFLNSSALTCMSSAELQCSLQSLFSRIIFVVSQLCINPYLCRFSYIQHIYYILLQIILF